MEADLASNGGEPTLKDHEDEAGDRDGAFMAMPGYLLRRCYQIAVGVFIDECRAFDLTPLQFAVLAALETFGPLDQVRLSGVAALDRTTVIVVLGRLEESGLVTRTASRKDRRAKIAAITATGRQALEEVLPSVRKAQLRMLGSLSAREGRQLLALLAKMADGANSLSRAPQRLPDKHVVRGQPKAVTGRRKR